MIAGFCNFSTNADFRTDADGILEGMKERLRHRQGFAKDSYISKNAAFANCFSANYFGCDYHILYDGELYNKEELKKFLLSNGYKIENGSDMEIILKTYLYYGVHFVDELDGLFSIVIYDTEKQILLLFADRFAVKPLFYTVKDGTLVFASEIKALFKFPGVKAVANKKSLCEIFGLGPARSEGSAVFKNIYEVKGGHFLVCDRGGDIKAHKYFELAAREHELSYEETVAKAKELLDASIKRQLGGENICCFLSGGLDSSYVSAVYASQAGSSIDTFSFDYVDNDKYFRSNNFQPDIDRPWVEKMVAALKANHTFLFCDYEDLADNLYEMVRIKDYPGMADVDSSLLYFCREVAETHSIALTGECSDEIFQGYPWFHREELINADTFPWSRALDFRRQFLREDVLNKLGLDRYVEARYEKSLDSVPRLPGESGATARNREISWLTLKWFMKTLIERTERIGTKSGLTARIPFCDYRLISFLYNVPYEMKCKGDSVKSLLRDASAGLLPEGLINRKKSPYPKTYNPQYEAILKERLGAALADEGEPIHALINKDAVEKFLNEEGNVSVPWFGQLMATPQMAAYLLQVNYWLKEYEVEIEI